MALFKRQSRSGPGYGLYWYQERPGLWIGGGIGLLAVAGGVAVYLNREKLGIGLSTGSSGAGWRAGSAVQLNEKMQRFLDQLAPDVGVPLFITSGVRTAQDQARALLKKLSLGEGMADLKELYKRKDLVGELGQVPETLEAWTSVLADQVSRGDLLSSHLSGQALDIRTTGEVGKAEYGDLTPGQVKAVKAAATALGARVIEEGTPPHLHLELGGVA
jgi:hypothetical protein